MPHLSNSEILRIEKASYRHLCDMFLEMIKTLNISAEEMNKRYQFSNIELVKNYEKKGKSIILMTSHYASWEWSIILGKHIKFKGFGVYKKLKNKYFDQLVRNIRSKFDAELIPINETARKIKQNQNNGIHGIYLFLSDQTPILRRNVYWKDFMGIEVPVHIGAENLARELDMNVLYLQVDKIKRGYYQAQFIEITDNIASVPKYEVVNKFLNLVENQIKNKPEYYFWTHKRWKHAKNKADMV